MTMQLPCQNDTPAGIFKRIIQAQIMPMGGPGGYVKIWFDGDKFRVKPVDIYRKGKGYSASQTIPYRDTTG